MKLRYFLILLATLSSSVLSLNTSTWNLPAFYVNGSAGASQFWNDQTSATLADENGDDDKLERMNNPLAFNYGIGTGVQFSKETSNWLNSVPLHNLRMGIEFNQLNRRQQRGDYYNNNETEASRTYHATIRTQLYMFLLEGDFIHFKGADAFFTTGIGEARNTISNLASGPKQSTSDYVLRGKTRSNLAYELGLGISYQWTDYLATYLTYRFIDANEIDTDTLVIDSGAHVQKAPEFTMHLTQFLFGVRVYL